MILWRTYDNQGKTLVFCENFMSTETVTQCSGYILVCAIHISYTDSVHLCQNMLFLSTPFTLYKLSFILSIEIQHKILLVWEKTLFGNGVRRTATPAGRSDGGIGILKDHKLRGTILIYKTICLYVASPDKEDSITLPPASVSTI